jgi:hypothetical protein
VDDIAEATLLDELEHHEGVGRKAALAAAADDGRDEQLALVDEAGPECSRGERGPADEDGARDCPHVGPDGSLARSDG